MTANDIPDTVLPFSVLLIDDDPEDLQLIREHIAEIFGHGSAGAVAPLRIETCGTVAAAEARLAVAEFDAVVTDLTLPDGQGRDTIKRVRAAAGTTPVIVMTGQSASDIQHEARRVDAAFLEKSAIAYRDLALRLRALAAVAPATAEGTLSLDRLAEEAAQRGAKTGARAVLHELGLDDPAAARDLRELRDLLRAWRDAKRVAWRTVVRWVTTVVLAAIAAGAAFWATGRYAPGS